MRLKAIREPKNGVQWYPLNMLGNISAKRKKDIDEIESFLYLQRKCKQLAIKFNATYLQ